MAKKKANVMNQVVSFIAWLTGVIVSLAVGIALTQGTLSVPYIGVANEVAGWIVVFTTLLGAVLAIVNRLK